MPKHFEFRHMGLIRFINYKIVDKRYSLFKKFTVEKCIMTGLHYNKLGRLENVYKIEKFIDFSAIKANSNM